VSDRFPAEITIGGPIKRADLEELAGEIAGQGVSLDYGEHDLNANQAQEAIEKAAREGATLKLCDDQACYGLFDELEGFCKERGIHFDRHSDAYCEWTGENVYNRDGEDLFEFTATQDGQDLVEADTIRKILAEPGGGPVDKLRAIEAFASPAGLTPLAPITLID